MPKTSLEKPPAVDILGSIDELISIWEEVNATDYKGRYLHWSKFKWRVPREKAVLYWRLAKLKRFMLSKSIGLVGVNGLDFRYCTPLSMQSILHTLDKSSGVKISDVGSSTIKNGFLVSSFIKEAIKSAQLEGATTTYEVAKKMLEDDREPATEDERMILNNYALIRHAEQQTRRDLSIDMILEFHQIATIGTSSNHVEPGKLRSDNDIFISDDGGEIAYQPPSFEILHDRLVALCEFANNDHSGNSRSDFIHPLIKAITLHFMIGYEHPFRDGNGRVARAIFYWFVLKSQYNIFNNISISNILKEKPRDYGLSYLYTETDDNDLTYFIYFQLETIQKAVENLKKDQD